MKLKYDAVLFDLLTALLDSWSVWNESAGSEAAGRRWRAEYLKRTYGCGAYRPYETLVREAAEAAGLDARCADALDGKWPELAPWPDAQPVLSALRATHRLGVVTNCSEQKGRAAAERVGVRFDVVVSAERAGYYKPDPRPYRVALETLELPAERVLFVAGSGYDLFGTHAVGLDTYWHNRLGIAAPQGAPAPLVESRSLHGLPALALTARAAP
ncbi:MAG TPA: HAD-IA family hydrolase [Burkholderiales bacterium]|nr:HAD-IA family hydrolase [Burkholderiales bacterium]